MEALIIIVIIGIIWLLVYLNKADTKFKNAIRLIHKKRFDEAQEILFKLTSKHSLAVPKYAECFFIKAEELKNKGKISEAITNYNKVLDSKKLLTIVSDKPSFYKFAESAFYEISKLQLDYISTNANSLERIKALKINLDFIKNSEFNKSNQIPKLIEKHKEIISKLYFELGQKEEKNGDLIQARNNYSNALTYCVNKNDLHYFNLAGRIELCNVKLDESIVLENIKQIDKANTNIRNDFYFRYSIKLIKEGNLIEAENIIHNKLNIINPEIEKVIKICWNNRIISTTDEISKINNQINEIYNNTASIDLLVSLYDSVTVKGNELNKVVPGILNDLEELKPSLLNRILHHYNENNEYGKAINAIIKFPEFYNSPLLMKNLGNASFNFLKIMTSLLKTTKLLYLFF
jgi:tetratricopeptide (TPR) repeat protein